jgi:hypothetical protein
MRLGVSKPKPTLYNLHMAYQTIAKPLGLIKDFNFFVHSLCSTFDGEIEYCARF